MSDTSIKNTQNAFADAIVTNDFSKIDKIVEDSDFSKEELFAIYRGNFMGAINHSAKLTFPSVLALVGDDFFKAMMREFVKESPPNSTDLNQFGENLPNFIKNFEHTQDLPYLNDIAKFDWCLHLAHFANEEISTAKFTNSNLRSLYLRLKKSSFILKSEFPILEIYQMIRNPDQAETINIDRRDNQQLLIYKNLKDKSVEIEQIDKKNYEVLKSIKNGAKLSSLLTKFEKNDENCLEKFIKKFEDKLFLYV